ncbi:MAG TPA: hypothetical protein VLG50_03475 [Candidatus Saccharimonadales bacterium]|nr:hypothetical protein [Candidatus Saccharimonadales bacterium]
MTLKNYKTLLAVGLLMYGIDVSAVRSRASSAGSSSRSSNSSSSCRPSSSYTSSRPSSSSNSHKSSDSSSHVPSHTTPVSVSSSIPSSTTHTPSSNNFWFGWLLGRSSSSHNSPSYPASSHHTQTNSSSTQAVANNQNEATITAKSEVVPSEVTAQPEVREHIEVDELISSNTELSQAVIDKRNEVVALNQPETKVARDTSSRSKVLLPLVAASLTGALAHSVVKNMNPETIVKHAAASSAVAGFALAGSITAWMRSSAV